jgi:glycosyltransferase involved in cell wall biosynthesis
VKRPLVSFIIPVLNGERYIVRCLLSIKNLDFPPERYEILVVDNGSTDKTHQSVRELGVDLRIVIGVRVGALRNRGVTLAVGEYVAFIDADVELKPHWLQEGLAVFADRHVVATGCFPGVPQPATWVQKTWDIHQRGNQQQCERKPVSWLPSMNLLVRRDAFLAVGGFNEQLETAEDVDLCYRLGQQGTILRNTDMEAIHWGEAKDLQTFWRKEVWRGTGNLIGVLAHGLRCDELPSLGYPLYILCFLIIWSASCTYGAWYRQLAPIPLALCFLILPASALATIAIYRSRQFYAFPQMFLLYFVYGVARAFSLIKAGYPHMRTRNQELLGGFKLKRYPTIVKPRSED